LPVDSSEPTPILTEYARRPRAATRDPGFDRSRCWACRLHNESAAHGLLSGRISPDQEFSEDDWCSQSDLFWGENLRANLEQVEKLGKFAEERDQNGSLRVNTRG
jgi:hypothetical protein